MAAHRNHLLSPLGSLYILVMLLKLSEQYLPIYLPKLYLSIYQYN